MIILEIKWEYVAGWNFLPHKHQQKNTKYFFRHNTNHRALIELGKKKQKKLEPKSHIDEKNNNRDFMKTSFPM